MTEFGFSALHGSEGEPSDAPDSPATGPSAALDPTELQEPLPEISGIPPLGDIPTIAEIIGNEIELAEETSKLQLRQRKYITLIAKQLILMDEPINGQAIYKNWPVGMNFEGEISSKIKNPEDRGKAFRAGPRPYINEIQAYLRTREYALAMREMGFNIDLNDNGLTAEQMGFLTILSNPADGKDLRGKLRLAQVPWGKYQLWLKEREFRKAHDKMLGDSLKAMMPIAEQALAAKIAGGDVNAIKFGMEVTGRHNPNGQKQLESEALLAILLEVIEEEIKDMGVLQRIASKVQLRGVGKNRAITE
jgi:hypothetical protein